MKRVLIKSVHDAFGYVMEHYYPFGMEQESAELGTLTDTYAVISIQDSHTKGFGFQFTENQFCKGVLTLQFDDIVTEVDGAVIFDDSMAEKIIDFVEKYQKVVDTLLVHCYAGQSRSRAVGAFAVKMLGGDNSRHFEHGTPNRYIYDVLEYVWLRVSDTFNPDFQKAQNYAILVIQNNSSIEKEQIRWKIKFLKSG